MEERQDESSSEESRDLRSQLVVFFVSILSRLCLLWMKSCGSIFSCAALLLLVTITNYHQSMNVRDFVFCVYMDCFELISVAQSTCVRQAERSWTLSLYFQKIFRYGHYIILMISSWWLLVWHFFGTFLPNAHFKARHEVLPPWGGELFEDGDVPFQSCRKTGNST